MTRVEWRACWMVRLVLVIMIVEIVVWKNRPENVEIAQIAMSGAGSWKVV